MVSAGGVDQKHVGTDGERHHGCLEQRAFPEREESWLVGSARFPELRRDDEATSFPDRSARPASISGPAGAFAAPLEAHEHSAGENPGGRCPFGHVERAYPHLLLGKVEGSARPLHD